VSLHGEDVTLAFPASKAFSKRKAEQDDYRRVTADALRTVLGLSLALRYELRDPDDLPQAGAPSVAEPGLSQEELVRRLVEEFDAQEVLDENPDQEA
jgi:DNA polymerase-3 subunit gamma/tau